MVRARFFKTIFIPDLNGQRMIWKNDLLTIVRSIDEIVQFGNIISINDHLRDEKSTGPNEILLYYIMLWRSSFEGWTQLVGPNEIIAMNFPGKYTNNKSDKVLREHWLMKDGWGNFHTAGVNKNRLLTHGGLTYGEWLRIGRPRTAQEAADRLNEKYDKTLYQGPCLKLNNIPNFYANPIFADPLTEVYPSWITAPEPPPFQQMHSGGGYNTVDGYQATSEAYSSLSYADDVNYTNFGSIVTIKGVKFTSIYIPLPRGQLIKHVPKPWHMFIEKMPVLDGREEYFRKLPGDEGYVEPKQKPSQKEIVF